ncbi:hypothetical protein SteCoe_1427 [Stentor coeruleus]|uniref:CRAL-TRIO domain-containing protein n=1 Tax=Stentor coeruleus TaxID=5963 RepID=A0A1R2D1R6_9CILI|nr:hypothetical protein SteCoe_1427 [Stentor coeruleus]
METFIPDEVHRYWPTGDKVYKGSNKSIVRYIFYGIEFTDFELEKLEEFKKYLKLQGILTVPLSSEELIRTLIGCKFNYKKSFDAMNSAIAWRRETLPNSYDSLYPKVISLLNSGAIYIHGRDHRYRPLIVLNAGNLDLEKYSSEDYCNLLCFILEYTVQNLMVPGHVENWIIITDLNKQSLHKLPMNELKSIIKTLQDNFRCRMIVNYIVNAPRTLKFIWTVLKGFIEQHTVEKIRILQESIPLEMKTHFALHQYEIKYGGTAPNATQFWPPILPQEPYETEHEVKGAHLSNNNSIAVEEKEKHEEIFFSCARNSLESFYSFAENLEYANRGTVYTDAIAHEERLSKKICIPSSNTGPEADTILIGSNRPIKYEKQNSVSGYMMINDISSSDKPRKKKCCERCIVV